MRYFIALAAIAVLCGIATSAQAAHPSQHARSAYGRAISARHTIRHYRKLEAVQAHRANVKAPLMRRLPWKPSVLRGALRWHHRHLVWLRGLPTYVRITDLGSWACIHRYESGGSWHTVDNNGGVLYHGGVQMDQNFEEAYGRDMLLKYHGQGAEHWTVHDQLVVAQRGKQARGWQPWSTAGMCGL